MFTFDLMAKLRQCNSRIYLVNSGRKFAGNGLAGIWLKKPRKYRHKGAFLTKGAGRLREASEGHIDLLLSNTPYPEIPEFSELSSDGKYLGRKGWRAIVKDCVVRKAFGWERARKVFGASMGQFDWDFLEYEGKVEALQREVKGKPWRKEQQWL